MSNLIEHLATQINNIVSDNSMSLNNDSNSQTFSNTIDEINIFLNKMGINEEIAEDITSSLNNNYNQCIENGLSIKEAYQDAFSSIEGLLSERISSESKISTSDDKFDLNFAGSSDSDTSLLIDQAISQGMTVEEAIKYVNNSLNYADINQYGPPTLTEIEKNESLNSKIASSLEENNLNKIEADMDDQAAKIISNDESDSVTSDNLFESKENSNDDEIS